MAMTHPVASNARGENVSESFRGGKMKFQVGDKVREGMHVGVITDVGTVLIHVRTNEGGSRVVCPWELVPIPASHDGIGSKLGASNQTPSRG
jgi:hypothetical protein